MTQGANPSEQSVADAAGLGVTDVSSLTNDWIHWFRQAAPYINLHRNRVLVLTLVGEALYPENLIHIIHDIALLNSLGVKMVLVFGAKPQIDEALAKANIASSFHQGIRITQKEMMPYMLEVYGLLRARLEAKLSMGLVNSPMHHSRIRVSSGNFVMARPLGVLNGIDFEYTGKVRRIDADAINAQLNIGQVVLLPAMGYSVNGEMFNLDCEELGSKTAIALNAHKLVMFGEQPGILNADGILIRDLTLMDAQAQIQARQGQSSPEFALLQAAYDACSAGVPRAHIIQYANDGALLKELFTRDGAGTMISSDDYEKIRPAGANDLNGIMALIRPLEERGILVRRSREMIETELAYFTVDERDGAVIGCAALYPFPADGVGELSCFAVRDDYRRHGRGDALLAVIEKQARNQALSKLFVLTTQTEQWFIERGFVRADIKDLPGEKLSKYNLDRKSKVLVKALD